MAVKKRGPQQATDASVKRGAASVGTAVRAVQPAKKRALAGLSEASIVDAARKLIRQVGVDALSMRMLAKQLGVSAMAVYYHVADKDELLAKVRESVIAQVPIETPAGESWETQIRAYATVGIMSLADYPGLLSYSALHPPTPSERQLTHHGIAILLAAGFEPSVAAKAITSFNCALFGVVVAYRQLKMGVIPRRTQERSVSAQSDHTLAVGHLHRLGFRQAADFTIDTFLKGLRLQLREQKVVPARRRAKSAR